MTTNVIRPDSDPDRQLALAVHGPPGDMPPLPEAPVSRWQVLAVCRDHDPELWHPVGQSGPALAQAEHAKTICRTRCLVVAECAAWAVDVLEFGIAGGLTEEERRAIRERRSPAAPLVADPSPLASLSAQARDAALAAGTRGRVADGVPMRVRSELVRSHLFEETVATGKSHSVGGIRATQAGRAALQRHRAEQLPQWAS